MYSRQDTNLPQAAQQHQDKQSASFGFNNMQNNMQRPYRTPETLPRYYPAVTMESGELTSTPQNPMGLGVWPLTPPETEVRSTTSNGQPTMLSTSFSYSLPEQYPPTSAWSGASYTIPEYQTISHNFPVNGTLSRYLEPSPINENPWDQKTCGDNVDVQSLDSDMNHLGQGLASCDENLPILDLRYPVSGMEGEALQLNTNFQRRMSGSSFSVSSVADNPPYDDLSAYSEAPSYVSDYTNRHSLNLSSTPLSPVPSPRQPTRRPDSFRCGSRGRASPSPRPNFRSTPYSVDSAARNKRWSTGSYAPGTARRGSPFIYHSQENFTSQGHSLSSRHSSPTLPHNNIQQMCMNNFQGQSQPYLMSHPHGYAAASNVLPPSYQDRCQQFENPPPLLSHGLFRMLQSNADPHSHHHSHYADMSDPPDLYASLHEEQIPPPLEDMNPSDPDMVPHEQELRFEGDLYTPRWVRGHGNKREGWCGICKPGRWLVLKNSAFWYDKSFTHGISAATGNPFQEPQEVRRMDGNPDVWEGLCGSCNEWVALVSSKKKGTTWFRHAYKCHTHPKVKDAPKRRRESSHTRALAAAKTKGETPTPTATPCAARRDSSDSQTTPVTASNTITISPLESLSNII